MSQTSNINPSGFEIRRGVNLSHWLSQNQEWPPRSVFITEKDIQFIDSIGYDHVRIPIDEAEMWSTDGHPSVESFGYLTRCLDWCMARHLRVIVDLHILRSHYFNAINEEKTNTLWTDTSAQNNFIKLWVDISSQLKKYPVASVAYELLNEAVAPDNEDWNKLINKTIPVLRRLEPARVLIVGSNFFQFPGRVPYLKVPEGDKNIIISFHTYSPLIFTHHLANWVPFFGYKGPVHYPGQTVTQADYEKYTDTSDRKLVQSLSMFGWNQEFNKKALADELIPAIQKAKELGLQLYCGEFGCIPHVERGDRLKYYDDVVSNFEENNIAWCNWEYKGDFGIIYFDYKKKTMLAPDSELINILLKHKKN